MRERDRGMMLHRKVAVWYCYKYMVGNPGELPDEPRLCNRATHMFEDRIGNPELKRVLRVRQWYPGLNALVLDGGKGGSEVATGAQACCGNVFGKRVETLDDVGPVSNDIRHAGIQDGVPPLGRTQAEKVFIDTVARGYE